jgi:hypothetical protein
MDGSRARELASTLFFSCRSIQSTTVVEYQSIGGWKEIINEKILSWRQDLDRYLLVSHSNLLLFPSSRISPALSVSMQGMAATCSIPALFRLINSFLHEIDPASQSQQENKTRNKTPWMDAYGSRTRACSFASSRSNLYKSFPIEIHYFLRVTDLDDRRKSSTNTNSSAGWRHQIGTLHLPCRA